jgi:hypothetical protein
MRSLVAPILISMLAVTAASAGPDDHERVAREHYEHGKQLVADGQFAAAFGEFSAGYDASPRAQFLFNMAECQRALGNAVRARELYERFVAASPTDPLVPTARTRLAELPPAPATEPSAVTPPPTIVESASVPLAATTSASAAAPSSRSLFTPIALGAGALALGGVAVGFDLWGNSTYDQAKAATGSQQTSLWHTANAERYAAEGFAVASVACAGAAIWLYLRNDHHETTPHHIQVVPTAGGLSLLGSY